MKNKITYSNPIVEMQGDEMTRIIWDDIKEILLTPYIELNTKFYDLGLINREKTGDSVTVDAANAIKKYHVGVKCATITPNTQRVEEYNLSKMWLSPNGTIRAILDGTVFRAPIMVKGITPYIPTWTKPITVARHAYGDVYRNCEMRIEGKGTGSLEFSGCETEKKTIAEFSGKGILQGIHNTDESISAFARSCFNYALSTKQDLWFATKDTISKIYDGLFKSIFADIFEKEFAARFEKANIKYEYTLIDDAVARVIRSNGGFIWALKNYDGDVMSDMIATAYGSLAMMTSVLVSPDGNFEYEAAHGTVTRHYYKHLKGEPTSTNPVATIFAWSGALSKRAELDGNAPLAKFAQDLETATLSTIESGFMTGDLVGSFKSESVKPVKLETRAFLEKIAQTLKSI